MNLDILTVLYSIPGVILALFLHEYSKALISTKLGDTLPRQEGRLSLNPLRHLEPIGFCFAVFFGFGWGQPVKTSSLHYKNRKTGTLVTYTIPSLINLLIGLILFFLVVYSKFNMPSILENIILNAANINIYIAIFNLIPITPLDASKVLSVFLSPNSYIKMVSYEKLLQIVLVILISMGYMGYFVNAVYTPILYFTDYILNIIKSIF